MPRKALMATSALIQSSSFVCQTHDQMQRRDHDKQLIVPHDYELPYQFES